MALTITATVGSASANSFATLVDWTTYMEGRLTPSTAFTDASTDEKNRALAEATRELSLLDWVGERTDDTQALSWPRAWAENPDAPIDNDAADTPGYYDDDAIPQRVKNAEYQLAFEYLKAYAAGGDVGVLDQSMNLDRLKVDTIELDYLDPFARKSGLARYPTVMREIEPLLANVSASNEVIRS